MQELTTRPAHGNPPLTSSGMRFDEHDFGGDDHFELRAYWKAIRRHLRLILSLCIVTELATGVVVLSMTPNYMATSTIIIERQVPELLDPKNPVEQSAPESDTGYDTFYRTQYEILSSRTLAARVIRQLALDQDPGFLRQRSGLRDLLWRSSRRKTPHQDKKMLGIHPLLVDAYLRHLSIKPQYQTRAVHVVFTSPDPLLSARIANAHVAAFISLGNERQARAGEAEQRFLESKLVELEKRIEKSERALNDYRSERDILNLSLDDKDQVIAERLGQLDRIWTEAKAEKISLEAQVEAIKEQQYDTLPAVVNNLLIQNLKTEASRLSGQYASLANQFTADYPPVAQLHAQLLEVQARENAETRKIVDSIKASYEAALRKEDSLRAEFENEKTQVRTLKNASLQDVVLAREVDTSRALYQSVLERIKVLGIASDSVITNVSVLDRAEIPMSPSSPKKLLSLILSGVLALMAGMASALIMEGADQGLKTSADVYRYLRLPNLATVLRITSSREQMLTSRKLLSLGSNNSNGKNDLELPRQYAFSGASEAYRAVRTGIMLSRSGRPPRTILFSSALAGEGKSATTLYTALAFAQQLNRVLLIDADLRRPHCHKILDREGCPGLTEVLTGLDELDLVVQPINGNGFHLLSAGSTPPNPTELLGSKRMTEVLGAATSLYQQVLIDSPPILPVSDSVVLSTLVDGVVVVAEATTPKQLVRDACARLLHVGANILGVVLNKVDTRDQPSYANIKRAIGNY